MIETYADADFSGLYTKHPISWKIILQSKITFSTTLAEYIALGTLMRELIPLRGIIQNLSPFLNLRKEIISIKPQFTEIIRPAYSMQINRDSELVPNI